MSTKIPYDRKNPYNQLPLLPPLEEKIMDLEIMTKLANARGALGKLDGIVRTLPNPEMLVNTITLREAKDSSEIENIFTSHDELYQAMAVETTEMSANAREVLRYREALEVGFKTLKSTNKIEMSTILAIYQKIENTTQGIRPPTLSTVIKKGGSSMTSGQVIYTPPRGKGIIENLLNNWLEYCNDNTAYNYDGLIKMAITHYQFEAIHPFSDGNGRTGRILNLLLLSQKELLTYPVLYLSGYIIRNKNEYYATLGAVTERFSWKNWILFILEGVEQTSYYTINLIEKINELFENTKNYILTENPKFNQDIIKLLFHQPYIRALNIVNAPSCKITSRQTADKKLMELVALNMLSKKQVGRETVYINHQLISLISEKTDSTI
jgi:Fic family protein